MLGNHTVAILLATYNGGKYIKTQIESIIAQDYENWKIFISDDGSKDETLTIVKEYVEKYPEKIELLEKEKPTGSAKKNFMYMLSKVKDYKYVMCCDQDDYWRPDKVRITLEKMLEIENGDDTKPCMVHTDLEVVDGELNSKSPSFFAFSSLDANRCNLNQILVQNIVTGCTMMVNQTMLKYAEKECNIDHVLMHDWWFALIAVCFGEIGFVDKATICYRQHGNNSVGAKDSKDPSYILDQIKKGNKNTLALEGTMLQAKEFAKVFKDELNEKDYDLIHGYGELLDKGKISRIAYVTKHAIWKNGFRRMIAEIIYL